MSGDERIAKGIEALARIAEDIKNEWRADRETQARRSNRGFLDLNTMRPLKTAGGRLVGYAFPNEAITVHETVPGSVTNLVPVPGKRYIVLDQVFDTPIDEFYRFNGTLYNLDRDKPVKICGQLVPESVSIARAEMHNRPGVNEFVREASQPFDIRVINIYAHDGQFKFVGQTDDGVNPSKQIEGTIKDVY
jgi:hypothetical protein